MQKRCEELVSNKENMERNQKVKDRLYATIQEDLEQANKEINHWKYNIELLENECQTLTSNVEVLQAEIARLRKELEKCQLNLEIAEKERDSWKRNTETYDQQRSQELQCEKTMLQDEILAKVNLNEKIRAKLQVTEQERDIFELKLKEKEISNTELEKTIRDLREEKEILSTENFDMTEKIRKHNLTQKELKSETEMSNHNRRFVPIRLYVK